jgi:IS605 OrfB family transposase
MKKKKKDIVISVAVDNDSATDKNGNRSKIHSDIKTLIREGTIKALDDIKNNAILIKKQATNKKAMPKKDITINKAILNKNITKKKDVLKKKDVPKKKAVPRKKDVLKKKDVPKKKAVPRKKFVRKKKGPVKFNRKTYITNLKKLVVDNNPTIWTPPIDIKYSSIKTDSWFDIKHFQQTVNIPPTVPTKIINKIPKVYHKTIKVELHLTPKQKFIFNNWFNAYTIMYNQAVTHIKYHKRLYGWYNTDFNKVRDELHNEKWCTIKSSYQLNNNNKQSFLKYGYGNIDVKDNVNKYEFCDNSKNLVKTHMLDEAIQTACSNFKSALTNKAIRYIKSFRIRHLKINRKNRILKIEQQYFTGNSICHNILGDIFATYNGDKFDLKRVRTTYKSDCLFKHDSETGKYMLYIPTEKMTMQNKNVKEFISFDPGFRTFLTGISEDEVVQIGNNLSDTIMNKLKLKEKVEKIEDNQKRKRKLKRISERLGNIVDDMHWKAIKYITSKYRNVLVGNLSTKSIISKTNTIHSPMYKEMIQRSKLYVFRQRLEYKCHSKSIKYKMVNESYTSKMCSVCGEIDDNLGSSKIYSCASCGMRMDRDINGARNIYYKRLM